MRPGLSPPEQPEEASLDRAVDTAPLCIRDQLRKMQPTEPKSIYLKVQRVLEEEPVAGVILEALELG